MNPLVPVFGAAAAVLSVYVGIQNRYFATDACARLEVALNESLVGQPLGTRLLVENICAHLTEKFPRRPLVLSLHGPPGVGKTYSHAISAQAMYGHIGGRDTAARSVMRSLHTMKRASQKWVPFVKQAGAFSERVIGNPLKCPGSGCPAYKVIYGLDFIRMDREHQHDLVRESILDHAKQYPESLFVIEEYDKLDCDTRHMIRQILHHPEVANVSFSKSVVLLEANKGMFPIQQLLMDAKKREEVSPYVAHHTLKEHMYGFWKQTGCETPVDAVRFGNLIDFFIPFFPLERSHIRQQLEMILESTRDLVSKGSLEWSADVIDYYVNQVQFDGAFAVDGAVDGKLAYNKVYDLLRHYQEDPVAKKCRDKKLQYMLTIEDGTVRMQIRCLK